MRTEPERQLQAYLDELYHTLPDAGQNPLSIRPQLHVQEAEGFLNGLKAGLFQIDRDGHVQSRLLAPVSCTGRRQKILQIFWHWAGGRILFREGVCQLAAASSQVLEYGWGIANVRLEPDQSDVGATAYGVDLTVRCPPNGPVLICGEVKKSIPELRKLFDDLADCSLRGPHPQTACHRKNHPKFEFCMQEKPQYFWAVCPGKRLAFRTDFTGAVMTLRPIDDIPQNPSKG